VLFGATSLEQSAPADDRRHVIGSRVRLITVTLRLTWLGHATVMIEMEGARLLTDPVLRSRVAHLRRQVAMPPDPGRCDAILISHPHRDHLDLPSLRRLDPRAPVIAPRGALRALRRSGREVHEMAAGDALEIAGVRVLAVRADHDGRRSPLSRPAASVGYVVAASRRVYFAGDTDLFAGMEVHTGTLDAALLPIWGWGSRIGAGHMDPERAARAVALLRPVLAVPIHWGTYRPLRLGRSRSGLLTNPAQSFAAHAARLAPRVRVEVLRPGEGVTLPGA
jgi:L-ascorbate metabolism protein UlaG (beta-lactamase superfamily)